MTEYQRAARMSVLQWFENLETCRWDYVIHETFLCMLNRWKFFRWWYCNTWCYGVGYKSLTGTIKKGQLCKVICIIKYLYNSPAILIYGVFDTAQKNGLSDICAKRHLSKRHLCEVTFEWTTFAWSGPEREREKKKMALLATYLDLT